MKVSKTHVLKGTASKTIIDRESNINVLMYDTLPNR